MMAASEWQDLLSLTSVRGLSTSDLVGQLVAASSPNPSGALDGVSAISTATGGSDTTGGLLQDSNKEVAQQISSLTAQLLNLGAAQQSQTGAVQDNTQAVTQNTASKGSDGNSVVKQIGSAAESVFGSALGLSPIISGLVSLFTGGSSSTVTPTVPFALPPPVQYQAGMTAGSVGQVVPVSFGEGGQPRPQATAQAAQVTVQVNALDSQSFLDHSDEIASALKQALLNSNSVADVISDL
jgi:hypothetical protein